MCVGPSCYHASVKTADPQVQCAHARWDIQEANETDVESLAAATGLSHIVARVLHSRGLRTAEDARRFLEPDLDRDWLDPSVIPGMDEAADAVVAAISANDRIVVFGDFDLDGISSAAVAARGLRAMGADIRAIVPNRFTEGYGLTGPAIERILAMGANMVVTVDCGISAESEVRQLLDSGVRVVVTDHHEPSGDVPQGVPVADTKLTTDCPSGDLAGAGVALKLVQSVGERLGHPDVWRDLTDLAMLGTIADIVPLVGENRALVADGIARVRSDPRVAISALCAVAGVSPAEFGADSVAFGLAPRLNAAGRMSDPDVALCLLMTDDALAAEESAMQLDEYNKMRQRVELDLSEAAAAQAERTYRPGDRAVIVSGEGWHEGVKGIVASRLAARFGVPALLFAIDGDEAQGSGRSAGSVDLFSAISSCSDLADSVRGS